MKYGKIWGTTTPKLVTPFVEVHLLEIFPNSHCSEHVHHHKRNAFIVCSGVLFIDVVKKDYPLTDSTELREGECTTVRAGEYHRFRTGPEPCVALEIYYPETMTEDIERKDHGGLNNDTDVVSAMERSNRGDSRFRTKRVKSAGRSVKR